jgi:L-lactate dehydrogenase
MIPWSITNIAGIDMEEYCNTEAHKEINKDAVEQEVRGAGAEVIKRKGATFYAIALSINKICDTILRDSKDVISVSTLINGSYGINDVCLSLPCIIGGSGIEKVLTPSLTDEETEKLRTSAKALRNVLDQVGI